jgi:hypothetical protein
LNNKLIFHGNNNATLYFRHILFTFLNIPPLLRASIMPGAFFAGYLGKTGLGCPIISAKGEKNEERFVLVGKCAVVNFQYDGNGNSRFIRCTGS